MRRLRFSSMPTRANAASMAGCTLRDKPRKAGRRWHGGHEIIHGHWQPAVELQGLRT